MSAGLLVVARRVLLSAREHDDGWDLSPDDAEAEVVADRKIDDGTCPGPALGRTVVGPAGGVTEGPPPGPPGPPGPPNRCGCIIIAWCLWWKPP